jgi:hypothetical protein
MILYQGNNIAVGFKDRGFRTRFTKIGKTGKPIGNYNEHRTIVVRGAEHERLGGLLGQFNPTISPNIQV